MTNAGLSVMAGISVGRQSARTSSLVAKYRATDRSSGHQQAELHRNRPTRFQPQRTDSQEFRYIGLDAREEAAYSELTKIYLRKTKVLSIYTLGRSEINEISTGRSTRPKMSQIVLTNLDTATQPPRRRPTLYIQRKGRKTCLKMNSTANELRAPIHSLRLTNNRMASAGPVPDGGGEWAGSAA
jgi:hypothetical protein